IELRRDGLDAQPRVEPERRVPPSLPGRGAVVALELFLYGGRWSSRHGRTRDFPRCGCLDLPLCPLAHRLARGLVLAIAGRRRPGVWVDRVDGCGGQVGAIAAEPAG